MAKILAKLNSCPNILWKVEIVNNKIIYLTEEIPQQNIEVAAWTSLGVCIKIQGEKNDKDYIVNRKEFYCLESSQWV